jgi:hypothetical protein
MSDVGTIPNININNHVNINQAPPVAIPAAPVFVDTTLLNGTISAENANTFRKSNVQYEIQRVLENFDTAVYQSQIVLSQTSMILKYIEIIEQNSSDLLTGAEKKQILLEHSDKSSMLTMSIDIVAEVVEMVFGFDSGSIELLINKGKKLSGMCCRKKKTIRG